MYIIRRIKTKLTNTGYRLAARFGGTSTVLKPLQRITNKKGSPRLVVFGCLGNICRSPYAHTRLVQLLKERNLNSVEVKSFGIETTPGLPADKNAQRIAKKLGLDLADHQTSRLDPELIRQADLILVMEPTHLRRLRRSVPEAVGKSMLLGALAIDQGFDVIIEDPFMREDEVFEKCFAQIDQGLRILVDRL